MLSQARLAASGLMRYENPSAYDPFRQQIANFLGKTLDDPLTEDDIKKLAKAYNWDADRIANISQWQGWPIRWVGEPYDSKVLPDWWKTAVNLARIVGKSVDDTFTAKDLDTVAARFGWDAEHKAVFQPLVGHSFADIRETVGQSIIDTVGKVFTDPLYGTGIPSPFDAVGQLFTFLSSPDNWLSMGAIVGGIFLLVFSVPRFVDGLNQ